MVQDPDRNLRILNFMVGALIAIITKDFLSRNLHLAFPPFHLLLQVFRIRELAMCIIGRLSNLNPAFVMPTLRKVLIQILTELEYSGIGRMKEQSAKLLGHLIANAPKLVRPYQEPILKVYLYDRHNASAAIQCGPGDSLRPGLEGYDC